LQTETAAWVFSPHDPYNEIDFLHRKAFEDVLWSVAIDYPAMPGEESALWLGCFSKRFIQDLSTHKHPEHSHRDGRTVDFGFYLNVGSNNTGYRGGKVPCKTYMDYSDNRMIPGAGSFKVEKNVYLWYLLTLRFPAVKMRLDFRIYDEVKRLGGFNGRYEILKKAIHRDTVKKYNHDTHIHADLGHEVSDHIGDKKVIK